MGILSPNFKKAFLDDMLNSINSNTAHYYAYAANPLGHDLVVPPNTTDDYSSKFDVCWNMVFGKRLGATNIMPMIRMIPWEANTVYDIYDNYNPDLDTANFYAVVNTGVPGSPYAIFKCINNANGAPSQYMPDQYIPTTFSKNDGYSWRYITSVSDKDYTKFSVGGYMPVYPNSAIVTTSYEHCSVDNIIVTNAGENYSSYHDGVVSSVVNSTVIQVSANCIPLNNYYAKNGVYFYNTNAQDAQLRIVSSYVSNTLGNWVILDKEANLTAIIPGSTHYKISPQVKITSDGDVTPLAYSVVNSQSNTIQSIHIVEPGYGIYWANVEIISNTAYGTGASAYAIVPPPGGHGYNPEVELYMQGICFSFDFVGSEGNTIVTELGYDKIGIIKDPYGATINGQKSLLFGNQTFNKVIHAELDQSHSWANGTMLKGTTSNSVGVVVKSVPGIVWMVGDITFQNDETITDGSLSANVTLRRISDIYTKDITPLYTQNINNVTRANNQSESFKLMIQL